jgi:hypothetical protein
MQLLAPASDLEHWYNYDSLQRASKLDAIIKRRSFTVDDRISANSVVPGRNASAATFNL